MSSLILSSCRIYNLLIYGTVELFPGIVTLTLSTDILVVPEAAPLSAIEAETLIFEPVCEEHAERIVVCFEHTDNIFVARCEPIVELA